MQDTYYMSRETMELVIRSVPALHIRKWTDDDVQHLFRKAPKTHGLPARLHHRQASTHPDPPYP